MSMTFHPIRKACPLCGKPIKLVPDKTGKERGLYLCTSCDGVDPLRNPAVKRWTDSSLKPPDE